MNVTNPSPATLPHVVLTIALSLVASWPVSMQAQGVQLATDAPPALTPAESLRRFQVARGFHIELVASEPLLADPVAMAFDARGRILICEIHGYNLEGYLDVLELNKSGQLDTQVRRIPANDEAIRQAAAEQYGTVKRLEDTDGDGQYDRADVLADRLPPCYGVVPARDGVIVFCAPDVLFLADRDADGTAEVREPMLTGFGVDEMWTRINNPRWSVDNWIYGVSGMRSGGTIRGPQLAQPVALDSVCFRFRSDGSQLQAASGCTHGFGQAVDDWGDRFLCTNQQHALHVIPIANHYLLRNPYYAGPDLTSNISRYGHPARVYPTSRPDPWRRARAADPAWVRFYGEMEATANGYFTAASGQTIYQGAQFPPEYRGNHFSVDNAQNLIHRCLLQPQGVSYVAQRPHPAQQREFVTSTEQWFRPVNLTTGPDGCLYVVDMYRDIIEDYSAIPRYLQQQYLRSLIAGADKGRIWRIVADQGREIPDLQQLAAPDLVPLLSHENHWQRMTAQRLLVERQEASVIEAVQRVLVRDRSPQSRLHALYTLSALSGLDDQLLVTALQDEHWAVVVHALRAAEPRLPDSPTLQASVLALVEHPQVRVRLQLALTLGTLPTAAARKALAQLAYRDGEDPWIAAALLSSAAGSADSLVAAILRDGQRAQYARGLLAPLASTIGARRDPQQVSELVARLGDSAAQADRQFSTGTLQGVIVSLEGLIEGLQRGRATAIANARAVSGLRQLLGTPNARIRALSIRVAGLMKLNEVPEMRQLFVRQCQLALDEQRDLEQRTAAISVLAAAPFEQIQEAAQELLAPRQPPAIQLAIVQTLGGLEQPAAALVMLENFPGYTPPIQAAVLTALFTREDRLPILLEAVSDGRVPRASVDAQRRERLMQDQRPAVRDRARQLFSSGSAVGPRDQVLQQYAQALQLPRDVERGRQVFTKQCSKCHKLGDEGFEVGPDLLAARTRADETLLSDVLDPSSQITVGYSQYNVVTMDGRIYAGVLAAETATSVTLRAEEQKDTTVLRRDIDELSASAISMMPEGLEKEVTVQDAADLLAFLRQTIGKASTDHVTLFDDDPGFVDLLVEGDGHARLDWADPWQGKLCLVMSPPQRFAAQIPGWSYAIREHPEPGQFRYLRFAWKQADGDGIMLELAADGKWPAPDDARFRFYSGRNTTAWRAVEIAPDVPRQWTLVTRDLWQEFGDFTLTGLAPTAMGSDALFDQIQLLRSLGDGSKTKSPFAPRK